MHSESRRVLARGRRAVRGAVMVALCCTASVLIAGTAAHAAADTSDRGAAEGAAKDAADMTSPVGVWRTIDDHTHEAKALIEITRDPSGALTGHILTGLGRNHHPDKRCTACTDERKDQPMQGLTIIRHLRQNGDLWEGGEILDPENGKTYHCRLQLADHGEHLIVRGYLGVPLLGRSQTWIRDTAPDPTARR
ncbi:DUF2147 domain-containing protein [Robbsia sp. Bb-Pol-6]|uniref:DUF2147 domain-containing protein n=2 Tax=Robbsia betulipollinis TaxID=2981849 RepID=A0ABT3ZIP2_9BURK|nr:DUF2147 domain-containing protein [Robbsia betulipollinis]MCY0386399.1 DUF2147 domain-containing protein [Robbsia betulipollinis]